jgi:hypothetical protein
MNCRLAQRDRVFRPIFGSGNCHAEAGEALNPEPRNLSYAIERTFITLVAPVAREFVDAAVVEVA